MTRVEKEPLFAANAYFASCHASTVLKTPGGTLLCAYFAGTYEGESDVGIWLSRKVSGRWLAPTRVAKVDNTAHWNPVLMQTPGGTRMVFKAGARIPDWKSYTMISSDDGETWSAPVPYAHQTDALGPVRSKPIYLSNGSLLAPNSTESETVWRPRVDVSLDDGQSFRKLADIQINTERADAQNRIDGKGAIQPTLWESAPGMVHALLRTTCGRIFRADSQDYGKTWCEAYDTQIPNNNSGIDVARAGNALYLALNPVSGNWAARTPLVVLKSLDNGAHFAPLATLEDALTDASGARAEFSYPAIISGGDALHVTYTHMRKTIMHAVITPEEV